jgi:hypothetical protein
MKKINSNALLILLLIVISTAFYLLQLILFRSPRDTSFYFLQDMAFLPLQVAIVTIVLGKILSAREKKERLKKTNMMVSAFFSEIGTDLMKQLIQCGSSLAELQPYLKVSENWSSKDFQKAADFVSQRHLSVRCTVTAFEDIRSLLLQKRDYILIMLVNPTLLEHEIFTDMLWAVFHLTDELRARSSIADLPDSDMIHLNYDAERAYVALLVQWIHYMAHLKSDYPYLFSLEMRRNPFYDGNGIIVR